MRKMLIISMLLASANAAALESFLGKVTTLEPTYLPGAITFMLDSGNATCPLRNLAEMGEDGRE